MPVRLTRSVKWILIACFATFIVQQTIDMYFGGNLGGWLALIPRGFIFEHRIWQIVTYSFLHGEVMHLFLNLMMLVFIGCDLEAAWGARRFLQYYFFCVVASGFMYLVMVAFFGGYDVPMVGASGAIYGLLMAYGLIFGERTMLFMMLFPMKAKHFIWVLAGIEFMSSFFSGRGAALASAAHLGGMAAGFCYLWTWAAWARHKKRRAEGGGPRGRRRKSKPSQREHLKLVINNGEGADNKPDDDGDDFDNNPKTWH